ncbi:hypothetical protein [Pseudoxanthomonas wuyuanensis]|uniref:Uncharacterized protein n=1 Tax=Pseudoxanthomonas wuyuanensis TaxID=1073196 RepID=A0A286DB37_9GAMM|nr:hypothetical protein [Pseudoxanthomonas wuyuanensis]SOD55857.1 hypothetical protein SAMN06296416_10850 [Pseudoxanthomonas wuyuanensis]
MRRRVAAATTLLAAAVLISSGAQARQCQVDLGRGWPPATDNYGNAVEQLFHEQAQPALSLVWLPSRGKETGLSLTPGVAGAQWMLRHSQAEERVYNWSNSGSRGGVQLRVEQPARQHEAPIPAELAQRLVALWRQSLEQAVPAELAAGVQEGNVLSFVVDGERFSGAIPGCGPTERMLEQAALMIEATTDKQSKRERRWLKLEASLENLQQSLADSNG